MEQLGKVARSGPLCYQAFLPAWPLPNLFHFLGGLAIAAWCYLISQPQPHGGTDLIRVTDVQRILALLQRH